MTSSTEIPPQDQNDIPEPNKPTEDCLKNSTPNNDLNSVVDKKPDEKLETSKIPQEDWTNKEFLK